MSRRLMQFALVFVGHVAGAIASALALGVVFGWISPWISAISLLFGFWWGMRFSRKLTSELFSGSSSKTRIWTSAELALSGLALFAAWKHFAWLMPMMPNPSGATVTTLSTTNYGDLPFHISLIRFLASGSAFSPLPVNPIFSSETLHYPFGVDLYSALWESLGVQTTGHLFLSGLSATLTALVLLREIGGVWGMAAFFIGGGAVSEAVDWKSLFLSVWITQRGFLLALPLGLVLLLCVQRQAASKVFSTQSRARLGWLWGIYPIVHAHSFVVVSLLMLFYLVVASGWSAGLRRFFFGPEFRRAVIPASVLIFYTSAGFEKASVIHLKWLWTWSPLSGVSLLDWALTNFGWSVSVLLLAVGVVLLFVQRSRRPAHARTLALEFGGLFFLWLMGLTVMLAPWDWDNCKVLIWPWVLAFSAVGRELRAWSTSEGRRLVNAVFAWLGLTIAFNSGIETLLGSWLNPKDRSTVIWTLEDIANAGGALRGVPQAAVFAAATTPNHALAYFGRPRVAGYEGHLWSHAIASEPVIKDLNTLMYGTEGWVEAAKRLKITHIYWGPDERLRYGGEPRPWQQRLSVVADSNGHRVYAVAPMPEE